MRTEALPLPFNEAETGTRLARRVTRPTLDTSQTFWSLGDWRLVAQATTGSVLPGMDRLVRRIREWTGWSARRLAEVTGTSHTTILGVEGGRPLVDGHSGELRRRLRETHDVIERLFVIAERNRDALTQLLEAGSPGDSALDALKSDKPTLAYLAAVEALRPRPQGLLTGRRPRQSGGSAPLHD